jgi:two-component system response regulator HydG
MVTDQADLRILKLSDSFQSLWTDLAKELGVQSTLVDPCNTDDFGPAASVASIVAAGGEEDRGLDLLLSLEASPSHPTYLIGAISSHRFAVEALRRGATDYFALPEDLDLLRRTLVARAEAVREARVAQPGDSDSTFSSIVGGSEALGAVLDRARRVITHRDVTVLIGGETGTGKELLARALHDGGPRASGPFVAINCAAIPATLIESELFGHEKGAFTDAQVAKAGLFEEAHLGTLFLDEIGHLPLGLQGKLLRAVDERRIRRVGGNEEREVDVRMVAATHVDLSDAVRRGEFRQDLFYRLNVVSLHLPPLRDRGTDLDVLAREFATTLAARYGLPVPEFTSDLMVTIRSHSWPGNVRELRHAIERALLLSEPGSLDPQELIPDHTPGPAAIQAHLPFPATLSDINSVAADRMVQLCDGNKSEAARRLGISRARLQRLLDHRVEALEGRPESEDGVS